MSEELAFLRSFFSHLVPSFSILHLTRLPSLMVRAALTSLGIVIRPSFRTYTVNSATFPSAKCLPRKSPFYTLYDNKRMPNMEKYASLICIICDNADFSSTDSPRLLHTRIEFKTKLEYFGTSITTKQTHPENSKTEILPKSSILAK